MGTEGTSLAMHRDAPLSYMPADPGRYGGGTLTSQDVEPTIEAYENIFGPSARDIKQDLQRFKRHGRWHLPDILKGPNTYLTDRVDGLITDATNSPFTSRILPYKYITNVDGKIKWNVWSFDEGLASRVPYESAARTLTQSKRSYSGYTVRQGLAIVLEHNFLMTESGRTNFSRQLNQIVGSIQLTNDLDVHVALVLAPSYAKDMREKWLTDDKTPTQTCREFVDLFGFVQKNVNALDILIEEAKAMLKTWGGPMPDFMLCNSKLTFQLTMTPDVTNYVTHGPEGPKRLRRGPNLQSYRGIDIVHTRAFSMETGAPPRDILRRRVRVAEYYRITPHPDNYKRTFQLFNEERDTWFTVSMKDLLRMALCDKTITDPRPGGPGNSNNERLKAALNTLTRNRPGNRPGGVGGIGVGHLGADAGGIPHDRNFLGQMVTSVGGSPLSEQISDFFVQIFRRKLKPEFVWDPVHIWNGLVYVPGAFDYVDVHSIDIADHINRLSPIILNAFRTDNFVPTLTAGQTQKRMFAFMVQSVAKYPRETSAFLTAFAANLPNDRDSPYFHGVVGGAAARDELGGFDASAAALPNTRICSQGFLRALSLRNYFRYGVPTFSVRSWGDRAAVKYETALNLAIPLDRAPRDQRLRKLGAFLCPNHFRVPDMPPFKSVGDHIGYNTIVTYEMVAFLTRKSIAHPPAGGPVIGAIAADGSHYADTFLYDIVCNPGNYPNLLNNTRAMLDAAVTAIRSIPPGSYARRAELGDHLSPALVGILTAQATGAACPFNLDNSDMCNLGHYWMWPRSDGLRDDVFHQTNTTPTGLAVKGTPNMVTAYTLPHAFLNRCTGGVGALPAAAALKEVEQDAFTTRVTVDTFATAASPEDAINFYHMLAWRLWADQELSLPPGVSSSGAVWGSPQRYLTYNPFTGVEFGAGLVPAPDGSVDFNSIESLADIEIVIVRPNIEHYMLGIILGQGGEGLGSTFWGQTELSCYDDSMHGIWGMSYKYNERAMVIDQQRLVKLWDIAYDSYVGGKSDSAVEWNDDVNQENPNSLYNFKEYTMHVTRHYRGPSMMVMAFHHGDRRRVDISSLYDRDFQSNWPSPIVFHDDGRTSKRKESAADYDNIHVVGTDEFRVFNREIYENSYAQYMAKMPDFEQLHKIRKNAGLAAVENEVSSDSLAFQGTMRILNSDGRVVEDIQGSGHHGVDFVGVSSLRNGKGYKIASQPTTQRLV